MEQEKAGAVWLRGDDEPRVLQSGETVLMGMYPPQLQVNDPQKNIIWEVNTMDITFDDMTPNPAVCPKYQQYQEQLLEDPGYKAHYESVTLPLLKQVATAIGEDASWANDASIVSVFDCLNSHLCHDFDIPEGFTQELYEAVVAEATYNWRQQFSYPTVQANAQAGIGFILQEVWNAFDNFNPANNDPLFRLWSGHDDTLIPVLNALDLWGQFNYTWVPYASYIAFEKYQAQPGGQLYLRTTFNGQLMTLPNCAVLCPWETAKAVFQAIFPQGGTSCVNKDFALSENPRAHYGWRFGKRESGCSVHKKK